MVDLFLYRCKLTLEIQQRTFVENTSKAVTLGFVVSIPRGEVWLAKKKTKLCADRYNGYGGSLKPGESTENCMIREFHEESEATTTRENLVDVGCISFYRGDKTHESTLICVCYIFLITDISGVMVETKEMGAPIPFPFNRLPFDEMMPSDRLWLPRILSNKSRVGGSIILNDEMNKLVADDLTFI